MSGTNDKESNIVSLEDFKRRKRQEHLLDRSLHRDQKEFDNDFTKRMLRIKMSLEKINFLMQELRKEKEKESEKEDS